MASKQPAKFANWQIMGNGSMVDPTTDKDPNHWGVMTDPPPDVHLVSFHNSHICFSSYEPPKGFTAEEMMKFRGAEQRLTVVKLDRLMELREAGKLVLRGDDRFRPLPKHIE